MGATGEGGARRPNVVMILSDDHAGRTISAYGSEVNSTPRIDEIAHRGVRFDNCFVTNSLCSPSRAAILTGTYSHINGVTTLVTPIDASQPTFVSQLSAAGYRTAMVGKWHMGHGPGHDPEGFDYWDVLVGLDGQGEYWDPQFLSVDGVRIEKGYTTDVITDLALTWLESLDSDEPYCVLIYHKAPHRPWQPKEFDADQDGGPFPVPETFFDDYATRSSSVRRAAMSISEDLTREDLKQSVPEGLSYGEQAEWKYQRFLEDYLSCVRTLDDNVGRVTDWLSEKGQLDDTVLMYCSDQGFFLGEHGWFDKRLMFEESLKMPLVLSYPRSVAPQQVHSGIITNVDFAQTILDFAGVEGHPRMQGRSFQADLTGDEAPEQRSGMYYRYWEHDDVFHKAPAHYGYRDDRYKIIYYYNAGLGLAGTGEFTYDSEWELYDLHTDPNELVNVYHDPAYRAVRERMVRELAREQAAVGDVPYVDPLVSSDGVLE